MDCLLNGKDLFISSDSISVKKKLSLLDKDERILYDKGVIDIDGELTEKGRRAFLQFIYDSEYMMREDFIDFVKILYEDENEK